MHYSTDEQTIGAALLTFGERALNDAEDAGLGVQHFSSRVLGKLFAAALALREAGRPITRHTLIGEAELQPKAVDALDATQILPGSAKDSARQVLQAAERAKTLETLSAASSALRDGAPVSEVRSLLFEALASSDEASGGLEHVASVVPRVLEEIERGGTPTTGTGLAHLDEALGGGLAAGELHLLAARPRVGKSALATAVAAHISTTAPVLVFSLEMSNEEQTRRVLAQMAGPLTVRNLVGVTGAAGEVADRFLWWQDRPCDVGGIERACRAHARRYGQLGLVVVDYLQIVPTRETDNRAIEVGRVSGALKRLAMELHCPILALAQLNRQVEMRPGCKPRLADLRESGSLEQDADSVWLLWRPELHMEQVPSHIAGKVRLEVAKFRRGSEGRVWFGWDGPRFRFTELDRGDWPKPGQQGGEE